MACQVEWNVLEPSPLEYDRMDCTEAGLFTSSFRLEKLLGGLTISDRDMSASRPPAPRVDMIEETIDFLTLCD